MTLKVNESNQKPLLCGLNTGNPEYELRPGTAAPLVGTLMEVLSSLWTKDGRLLVLAVGVARIRVRTLLSLRHLP